MKKYLSRPIHYFRKKTSNLRADPDFLIIGAQKSGTTSLYYDLAAHPKLTPNVGPKEVSFFTTYYRHGINYYRSYFPLKKQNQFYFQTSPYYLFHPLAPFRVSHHYPNMKLIAILRNPVHRAFSHFNHQKLAGRESLAFQDALATEEERLAGEEERLKNDPDYRSASHRNFSYVTRGIYIHQIDRWLQRFHASQLLVLSSEEYFNQPENTLSKIYEFLGVQPCLPLWVRKLKAEQGRESVMKRQANRLKYIWDRHHLSKLGLHRKINARPYKETPSWESKERLFEFFYPYNQDLFTRIGKDFGWNDKENL